MLENKEFYTRPNYHNKVLKQYNSKFYLIEEKNLISGEVRQDGLLTEEQIINYLNEQENIIPLVQKSIESHKKMLEIERMEQEKQAEQERQYNNTYGYTDNMPVMAKGKVLKILNKKENYYDNGKYIGTIARKDFIKNILESGGNIEHKKDARYWNKKSEVTIKENEYRLYCKGDERKENSESFYTITKTEYDFAMYLINNQLKKVI